MNNQFDKQYTQAFVSNVIFERKYESMCVFY